MLTLLLAVMASGAAAQTCPTEDPAIDSAKSHKLFLYFPTGADASFPNYGTNVSPAQPFDVATLNSAIGTTAQLIDSIKNVVADDYCEFNVQVQSTTTNPATLSSPPALRDTVAIGADSNGTTWGQAQEVDTGDTVAIDFARVWAGTYTSCEGGNGPNGSGCSSTGALTGANATLLNWGQAIGGTAAHEAGHTYGLSHSDDDPQTDPCNPAEAGFAATPGEDAFNKHLMPSGCNLTGTDRATYRRHFSDRDYGILATNVGLSIETMHNWDLVNPNAEQGASLSIDFLSSLSSVSIAWTYAGTQSPWINPSVSGPAGTATYQGKTYNKFKITWKSGNPAWNNPSPGLVGGGAVFHVGASFTGVDFNQPDPIIIQDVTLADAASAPLALHPRLPSYDAGSLDAAGGDMAVNFNPPPGAPQLRLASATIMQLPRMATIDSLVGAGAPLTRDGSPIQPWSSTTCDAADLRGGLRCVITKRDAAPHVTLTHAMGERGVVDCRNGVPIVPPPGRPRGGNDSTHSPDYEGPVLPGPATKPPAPGPHDSLASPDDEGPICAGSVRDPFPSATVYLIATFIDPNAKYFDATTHAYVTGPVTSKLFYQFAGIRHLATETTPAQKPPFNLFWLLLLLLLLILLLILWLRRRPA